MISKRIVLNCPCPTCGKRLSVTRTPTFAPEDLREGEKTSSIATCPFCGKTIYCIASKEGGRIIYQTSSVAPLSSDDEL